MSDSTENIALTSVSVACSRVASMWRAIQSMSRVVWAEPVTIRKRSTASRITVRSLSKPPRSFSIAV